MDLRSPRAPRVYPHSFLGPPGRYYIFADCTLLTPGQAKARCFGAYGSVSPPLPATPGRRRSGDMARLGQQGFLPIGKVSGRVVALELQEVVADSGLHQDREAAARSYREGDLRNLHSQ